MDYELQIRMTALNQASAKVDAVSKSVGNLGNTAKTSASGGLSNFGKTLESVGSRINVLGQRMTWMISVPLLAFGNKTIETALDMEKSWVRFRKVFSGTEEDFNRLKKSSEDLAVKFGRPIEEINSILAEFNKAGVSSADELEKLGAIVSETAITFDMELEPAMQGVKSVMMGFNLSADETRSALAALNIIADKTTASEQGILEVFNRAAGTARLAGLSFIELAASQAVFEKNAIPAGRAGNAMKSILVSLTKQSNLAKDQFLALGIDMSSTAWRTADARDKLDQLAKKLLEVQKSGDKVKLADLNEALASLVGKFQVNNLNVLLEDLSFQFDENADSVSQFYDGIAVASNETENLKWQLQQVNKVLESNPQKIDSLNQKYRLQAAILGNELLPYKIKLLEFLTKLIEKYNALPDDTKKFILIGAGLAAIIGPLLAMSGLSISALGFVLSFLSTVSGVGAGTGLVAAGVSLGLIAGALVAIATAWKIVKPAYDELQTTIEAGKKTWEDTNKKIEEYKGKIGSLKTDAANEQLKNATDAMQKHNDELKTINERYAGLPGVWNAVKDQFEPFITWWQKHWGSIRLILEGVWIAIQGTIEVAFGIIYTIFSIGLGIIGGNWKTAWEGMKTGGKLILEGFGKILTGQIKIWLGAIGTFASNIGKVLNSLIEKFNNLPSWMRGGQTIDFKFEVSSKSLEEKEANKNLATFGKVIYAASGYLARGRDTIPAMLSPGEMVLNRSQQGKLFDVLSGRMAMQTAGGPTVNINIGTMVASRGEQREFARKIKSLINEDSGRY